MHSWQSVFSTLIFPCFNLSTFIYLLYPLLFFGSARNHCSQNWFLLLATLALIHIINVLSNTKIFFKKGLNLIPACFPHKKKNKENALAGKIKNKYFLFKSHYSCAGCNRFHNLLFLKQHFYILFRADDEWKLMCERHAALLITAF